MQSLQWNRLLTRQPERCCNCGRLIRTKMDFLGATLRVAYLSLLQATVHTAQGFLADSSSYNMRSLAMYHDLLPRFPKRPVQYSPCSGLSRAQFLVPGRWYVNRTALISTTALPTHYSKTDILLEHSSMASRGGGVHILLLLDLVYFWSAQPAQPVEGIPNIAPRRSTLHMF